MVLTPPNQGGRVLKNVSLQSAPVAVSQARRTVRKLVPTHPAIDDILLLSSELVTNAVKYGQSDLVVLTVTRTLTGLMVSVADSGPGFIPGFVPMARGKQGPEGRDVASEEDGRGLVLVATLALQWGMIQDAHGTTVWFIVGDRPPDARRDDA